MAKYALTKKGAELECWGDLDGVFYQLRVKLPRVSWGDFLDVQMDKEFIDSKRTKIKAVCARFPVYGDRSAEHKQQYPAIQRSEWAERDGHTYMEISLDADVPIDALKLFVDEAYEIAWSKLNETARYMVDRASAPFDDLELLDELIVRHNFQELRPEILQLVRPGVLLRTRPALEDDIPLGSTKIGGLPDLPASAKWPVYLTGKPLAFLAQIDLKEIAALGQTMEGWPTEGTLAVFSAWGWQADKNPDPDRPREGWLNQERWTAVLHTLPGEKLQRRSTPKGVGSFRAAAVEPILVQCLPNHREEPSIVALGWSEEVYDRFDRLVTQFRSIQRGYWFKKFETSHHALGGYAAFQQQFCEELLTKNWTMFLQIGSDKNTNMGWSDDGELTFCADAEALREGRFERIWGNCQGG